MNWMKIGGIVLTGLGFAVSIGNKGIDDKKRDDTISKKVAEALAKKE